MASVQTTNKSYENDFLLAIIEKMYLKTETADVYFVFGDNDNRERVPAHKSLLAAGSDVFKAMFYGDLKETGDVEITDASAEAFEEFLQFFYRSKVNLTVENAFDVVNLCKKYDVAVCLNICDRFLKDELTLTNDSVCLVYALAIFFDLEDLKKLCKSNIVENTKAVFDSASFLDCDRNILSHILKFDELSCSEVNVFHACINWVKAKSEQEEVTKELVHAHLGDLFYEIRFGSMKLEEFVDLTILHGKLFSVEEYQEIMQMIRSKDFQPKMFKKDGRQGHKNPENKKNPVFKEIEVLQWNPHAVIECNRINQHDRFNFFPNSGSVERTKFTTNQPVLLGEIMCIGSIRAEMSIYEISSGGASQILCMKKILPLRCERSKVVWKQKLPKPILIKPGFEYEIESRFSGENALFNMWTRMNLTHVRLPGTDIIIKFNNFEGMVTGLGFNLISSS